MFTDTFSYIFKADFNSSVIGFRFSAAFLCCIFYSGKWEWMERTCNTIPQLSVYGFQANNSNYSFSLWGFIIIFAGVLFFFLYLPLLSHFLHTLQIENPLKWIIILFVHFLSIFSIRSNIHAVFMLFILASKHILHSTHSIFHFNCMSFMFSVFSKDALEETNKSP